MEIPISEPRKDKIKSNLIVIWTGSIILSFVLIAIAALVSWQIPDIFWKYLFFLRAPIFWGLLLITLPFIAIRWRPAIAMLRNLFVLRGPWQLFFVIVTANLAGIGIVINSYMILNNSSNRFKEFRFGELPPPEIPDFWQYVLTLFWFSIILFFTIYPWLKEKTTENNNVLDETIWILAVIIAITFALTLIVIKKYETTELWLFLLGLTLSIPIVFNCYQLTKEEESDQITKEEKSDQITKLNRLGLILNRLGLIVIPLVL